MIHIYGIDIIHSIYKVETSTEDASSNMTRTRHVHTELNKELCRNFQYTLYTLETLVFFECIEVGDDCLSCYGVSCGSCIPT